MSRLTFISTVVLLALAIIGPLTQHGQANAVTYLCVGPAFAWFGYQAVRAIINALW